jgi:hypothetical protein
MLVDRVIPRVLDDPLANAQCKIQPTMCRIALLEVLNDPQRVQVVVESTPVTRKTPIQRSLPGMAKGRMSNIMNQRQRLGQIFVQSKRGSSSSSDLSHFNRMGKPAAKMVGGTAGKYLRLPRQTPERASLHNTLAVTLKRRTRGAVGRGVDTGQKKIVWTSHDRASMQIDCHGQLSV